MDRCTYRRILADDGGGRRRVEVVHEAGWRLLLLSGKFVTRLMVEEDHALRVMRFELLPHAHERSIMSRFHGSWRVDPHPDRPGACISTLDQDIALGIWMPPPFDRILKAVSCRQVLRIFDDLRSEAARIKRGEPTLAPYAEVKDKEVEAE
jgi:hypothetical protein